MVDTKDQSNAIVYWVWYFVWRHCQYKDQSMQGIECYICWHCQYKTHPYIPAHNFLNIQWIFNPQKVLESWDSGLFNHTIYTIYVDTVDTRQGSLMHSMLSMSTLSIQFSHLMVLCIRCHVRATNTSVDKHSIKCIACFDLHINSVDKNKIPYSIHNSIALIFGIDHLDMPSCPFELQCRF